MRRLLRDISDNRTLGDVTTLANAEVVAAIAEQSVARADDGESG
jgi:acetyl-CoA synthetase